MYTRTDFCALLRRNPLSRQQAVEPERGEVSGREANA
jgi:hypothetical protein